MKRILVVNFFPAFVPPSSGGELRYFHLYSRLSQHFDVTLLSPTYSNHQREAVTHSPTFREYRIPKEPFQDQLHMSVASEKIAEEFSALVCALAASHPNQFHFAYCEHQATADLIIHESPYMLNYDFLAGIDRRPRIYNSYNVESDLVGQVWKGPAAAEYVALINNLEKRLITICAACLSVSEMEARRFAEKYALSPDLFAIVENGIVSDEFPTHEPNRGIPLLALFFGSLHPPNIEAAQYIVSELAPKFPEVHFVVAGKCRSPSAPGNPPNFQALGGVDNEQRLHLFATADIALNPMCSGAGTNLKALEYLAASLPLLSTPLGARGLDLVNNQQARIAQIEEFPGALEELIADPEMRKRLSASGRQHVVKRFSWDAIAEKAALTINAVLEAPPFSRRRHILLLNDFSVARPMGGGEVRVNRLYSALASRYGITLVCFGQGDDIRRTEIVPGFVEIQIPTTEAHRQSQAAHAWHISVADIVNYQEAPRNALLVSMTKAIAQYSDVIVLCHPYMAGLLKSIYGVPVIYESLNVESELKRALLVGHPAYTQMIASADECERLAVARSSQLISVSVADIEGLIAIGGKRDKIHIVPNGVDVPPALPNRATLESTRAVLGGRPMLIFIGSAHPPNVEAANYIIRELAPQLEDYVFGIVGSVCDAIGTVALPNVIVFGMLDDLTKDVVLELADVALNPMLTGSGSNLKLADYFAKGLPTVTTPFGARGYQITNNIEAVICSLEQFPTELQKLVSDLLVRERMGATAFGFAKAFLDWNTQAKKYQRVLERHTFFNSKKRLLIVTHRFTNPPLGGSESVLIDLLKELDHHGDFIIDLVTTDIVTIENEYQFSCSYVRDIRQPAYLDLASVNVLRFPVDEFDSAIRLQNSTRLWAAWSEESIYVSMAHCRKLPDTILLGGWYYPESGSAGIGIWSSPRALIRVKGAKSITLLGSSNHNTMLALLGDGMPLCEMIVDGAIELYQQLNEVDVVELCIAAPFISPGDPRQLGLRIREINVELIDGTTQTVPLDLSYSDVLKRIAPGEYIRSLIDVSRRRPAPLDALFQETRGPNSRALEAWLEQYSTNYDVILGHSLPFRTIVMAADAARTAGVPLVQLPHAHIDDSFYHWASYYQALSSAAICLSHPRAASGLFFDKIGARSWYLAHGVHENRSATPDEEEAFQQLYQSNLPYILVLGRKVRSKNYPGIIDAISKLNFLRRQCNVVMIGRDEDGDPLDGNFVQYLGGQPDGVVRAALGQSLCLVTMSDSESFGIVILEAWGQRRPVIVSENCIASTELVRDGECGLVANMANLSEKIASLLRDPVWASQMGARGFERVQAEFRWDAVGAGLNELLLNVANSGGLKATENVETAQ